MHVSLPAIVQKIFGVKFNDADNPTEEELKYIQELSDKLPPYASIILYLKQYLNITRNCSWSEIKSYLLYMKIFTFNICISAQNIIKQKDEEIILLKNKIYSLRLENDNLNKCIIVMQNLDSTVQCSEELSSFLLEESDEISKKRKLVQH